MAFGMQALRDAKIDVDRSNRLSSVDEVGGEEEELIEYATLIEPSPPAQRATPIEPLARVAETAAVAEGGDNSRHSNFPPAYPGKKLRPVKLKRFASLDPPTVVAVEGEDEEDATTEEGVPEAANRPNRRELMKPQKKRTGNCCSSRPTTSA